MFVDRLVKKDGIRQRLTDSIELAAKLAEGIVKISPLEGDDLLFSEKFACTTCGISYPEITPRLFSFNNPAGACPACDGIGAKMFFDPDLIVPDEELSIKEGAIEPWERRNNVFFHQILDAVCTQLRDRPVRAVGQAAREVADDPARGVGGRGGRVRVREERAHAHATSASSRACVANLRRRFEEYERRRREQGRTTDEDFEAIYDEFHRYMSQTVCEECGGTRLRKEARFVKVGGKSITEMTALTIREAHDFLHGLKLSPRQKEIAGRILRESGDRLSFLNNVGVDYLSLDRTAATLSGGESQRIRLATQIGSSLVGVLYILDEPSIGLHQRDNARLLSALTRLRDLGNSVLVVEHDEDTIRSADYVIDMGPRAGVNGGRIVAAGAPDDIAGNTHSLTGAYLSGRKTIEVPRQRRQSGNRMLTVKHARGHNLHELTVGFPIGVLTCVTGVSGSGKSTLVIDTLLRALAQKLNHAKAPPEAHDGLDGLQHVDKVIDIDQAPIGRTPRSNPSTYTGVFTHIRDLYANLPESKARGYKPGRYSFNVKGGRCEACQGDGIIRIEMHFLPDVYIVCESCGGRRYNRETLEVRYRQSSIADVLDMTVTQACEFLENIPKVRQKLETLREVGLGYIKLGQSATTLSGGEAQRIKLSKELAKKSSGRTVYILDEPTTGLHFADIAQLLSVLNRLVEAGNTVIVIEHNLDVIKTADWVIDLGPEGGPGGGQVVAQGTPDDVARVAASYTGQFLRKVL